VENSDAFWGGENVPAILRIAEADVHRRGARNPIECRIERLEAVFPGCAEADQTPQTFRRVHSSSASRLTVGEFGFFDLV
jgi:hypothetical protein